MPTRPDRSTILWIEPPQIALFGAVARAAELEIVGIGAPDPSAGSEIARAFEAPAVDNLRSALARTDAAAVIIGASGDFGTSSRASGASDADDAGLLMECRERGVRVLSLEPLPASVLQLDEPTLTTPDTEGAGIVLGQSDASVAAASSSGAPAEWATFCPLARLSPSVRDAAEVIAQLGAIRVMSVESLAGSGQGSLGARLYDACELCVWLMGLPDRVDGAFAPPPHARTRGVHVAPSETLRGLDGDLTVNLRFADGRAAAIVASNHAARWMRTVTLLGEKGRLRIFDDGFAWYGEDGRLVDSSRNPSAKRGSAFDEDPMEHAARVIADQIVRALDPHIPDGQPTDGLSVLATAGAALLSARTGENESPATILRMARTG